MHWTRIFNKHSECLNSDLFTSLIVYPCSIQSRETDRKQICLGTVLCSCFFFTFFLFNGIELYMKLKHTNFDILTHKTTVGRYRWRSNDLIFHSYWLLHIVFRLNRNEWITSSDDYYHSSIVVLKWMWSHSSHSSNCSHHFGFLFFWVICLFWMSHSSFDTTFQ